MRRLSSVFMAFALFGCAAETASTMETVIGSWRGAGVDEVIDRWGYPDSERTVAGRVILEWHREMTVDTGYSTTGYVIGNTFTSTTTGGVMHGSCTRQLEVRGGIVVGGAWQGNNCPFGLSLPPYDTWVR